MPEGPRAARARRSKRPHADGVGTWLHFAEGARLALAGWLVLATALGCAATRPGADSPDAPAETHTPEATAETHTPDETHSPDADAPDADARVEADAPPDADAPPTRFPTPSGQCIFLRTIEDWKAVDPYRLLVRTRPTGWQYEVLLDRRCSDILYANALQWVTPDTRVCDYRRDAIAVPGDRCTIGAIRAYDPAAKQPPANDRPID